MKPSQVLELARYRLGQARETLHEAEVLIQEQSWRGAVNRAYYAMFYSVLALAVTRQISTSRHSGVIAFFDREFVKTGVFPKDLSRKLHFAFDRRQVQDYGEFTTLDENSAGDTLANARDFVYAVETYLQSSVFPQLETK